MNFNGYSSQLFYLWCFLLGLGAGVWALFITTASEQFGTDLRATATTSIPNFARGMVIPLTLIFSMLQTYFSMQHAVLLLSVGVISLALLALHGLPETFRRNLDFYENKQDLAGKSCSYHYPQAPPLR